VTSYYLVIGGGVSGLGAAKWLRKLGHAVRVSNNTPLKPDARAAFLHLGAEVHDAGHDLSHLSGITHVVLSPGLPADHMLVAAATARGLPMISEIDLALQSFKGKLIGVTGTNGKSTICAMLGHILEKSGSKVSVGGNFGDPPTAMLAEGRMGDVLVLELSSYQLDHSHGIHADAAVFSSFSHDHMARHGSLKGYFEAKWRLVAGMRPGSLLVLPAHVADAALEFGAVPPDDVLLRLLEPRPALVQYGVKERHNQLNAAFALACAAHVLQCEESDLTPLIAGFRGLPHRCEPIGTWRGHAVINDSKSTNVESTLIALADQKTPVVLLMGGKGKDEPYGPILTEKAKIATLVTFGASGPEIARDLRASLKTHEFPTLASALQNLPRILEEYPHAVLFSPGCASFDEFQSYDHRGRSFRDAMIALGMRPA